MNISPLYKQILATTVYRLIVCIPCQPLRSFETTVRKTTKPCKKIIVVVQRYPFRVSYTQFLCHPYYPLYSFLTKILRQCLFCIFLRYHNKMQAIYSRARYLPRVFNVPAKNFHSGEIFPRRRNSVGRLSQESLAPPILCQPCQQPQSPNHVPFLGHVILPCPHPTKLSSLSSLPPTDPSPHKYQIINIILCHRFKV